VRLAPTLKALLIVGFAVRFHHRFHGPPIDYATLTAAAAASWVGVPGPGEPVLIAAGVFAARHKLDIGEVLLFAFAGAAAGGIAGWLIGMKLGRTVMTARGPLLRMRRTALARGDEVFGRWAVLAILLTPSWVAGIHRVRTGLYLVTNAVSAALWAVGIGLGAYFVGPAVVDFVADLGWITGAGLVLLVLAAILLEVRRRRRRSNRPQGGDDDATAAGPARTSNETGPPGRPRSAGSHSGE
jgi:membrane protein DedA with SNARE-associated domain